jgi:AraC-like DNA-binding protein
MLFLGHTPHGTAGSAPIPGWAGIGTTTLRELSYDPSQRRLALLDHHVLILVTVGHGTYEVDFRAYQCRPGTLIVAHPGQLVRYEGSGGLDAIIVGWAVDTLANLTPGAAAGQPFGPIHWQLAGEDEDAVINEVSQLVVDCQRHQSEDLAADLLRHQLAVLLLRLALLPGGPGKPSAAVAATLAETATYRRLRQEVEYHYGYTRRVEDYAVRLGCSVRTLTRACLAATGRSAKQVIDSRVALQARRLLAATDAPIADIGRRLGFPEPTNFGRFFQREVGQSPGTFRTGLGPHSPGPGSPGIDNPGIGNPGRGSPRNGSPGGPGDGTPDRFPAQPPVPGQRPFPPPITVGPPQREPVP